MLEAAGAERTSLFELSWKTARDAMLLVECGTLEILEANPAAMRLGGVASEQLIGRTLFSLHPAGESLRLLEFLRPGSRNSRAARRFLLSKNSQELTQVELSVTAPFGYNGRDAMLVSYRDLSRLCSRERRLNIKRWALRAYAGATLTLLNAKSPRALMQGICQAITQESPFVLAWACIANADPETPVNVMGAAGTSLRYLDGIQVTWSEHLPSGQGPTGIVLRTGQVYVLRDTEQSKVFAPWRERARAVGIRSSVSAPFHLSDGTRGALMVYSCHANSFDEVIVDAFTHLAQDIGIGLDHLQQAENLEAERTEREKARKELAAAFSGVIAAITTTLEMRDSYTAGHSRRVTELAAAIAMKLGWIEEDIHALKMATQVHDIGKVAIPSEVLNKATSLSAAEWLLIKSHPDIGYEILKDVPFRWPIAEVVRQHHERMDGSGYPRGLKGGEIHPGARVLAVADVVESMAHARPYRAGLGLDAALAEIRHQSGTLLDADVVDACLELFNQAEFSFDGAGKSPLESAVPFRVA